MSARLPIIDNSKNQLLPRIDDWHINLFNLQSAVNQIIAAAHSDRPFTVFTINLDHLVKLSCNELFRDAYSVADFISADGAPVAWLARQQNPAIERTTGADLLLPLTKVAAAQRLPVFLFGTSADALEKARLKLSACTAGTLQVAGVLSPSSSFEPRGLEADQAIEYIRRSGAKLCFIALGAPKQEIFAEYARKSNLSCGFICIGAAIDFIAGRQTRSPIFFQKAGMEWIWRLANQPRRLAKRYLDCALLLTKIVFHSMLMSKQAKS